MGADSRAKSESLWRRLSEFSSITLFVHARYGARKGLCTGLVDCGGVLVQKLNVQVIPTRTFIA